MTHEEIRHEALLDYLELKTKLQIATQDFASRMRMQSSIHRVVQNRTYRTRRYNNWMVFFYIKSRTLQRMIYGRLIYLPLRKGNQVYYLFLKGVQDFQLEIVTPHLLQRYRERYIEPNGIDVGGVPLAVHFQRYSENMRLTDIIPNNWDKEDIQDRMFWISDQGLIVSEEKGDVRTFITFLSQEGLSNYRALAYEEADFFRQFRLAHKSDDDEDGLRTFRSFEKVLSLPNAAKVWERHVRRVVDSTRPDYEKVVRELTELWQQIEQIFEGIKKERAKRTATSELQEMPLIPPELAERMRKESEKASRHPGTPENGF